jgi:hypothetical protein
LLSRILLVVQAFFGLVALLSRGRATHRSGVGASGLARVVSDPTFPAHDFFIPGRSFRVRLRHANLESSDDAAMDLRGASLKFADTAEEAPLDLVMNTGEASLFRDAWVFLDFVRARPRGAQGFRWMAERYPREWAAGAAGWRLAPSSYARLSYHSQIVTRFRASDGVIWWARYRLVPHDRGPDDGLPEPDRLAHPISLERSPQETRPKDYLRKDFVQRLSRGPVRYWLQVQLHLPQATDPAWVLDSSRPWDHPWRDLAEIVLERPLAAAETEALRFNVARQPDSLGLLPATGPEDYNSIGWLRTRVYPLSQLARTWRRSAPIGPRPRLSEVPASEDGRHCAVGRLLLDEPDAEGRDLPLHHVTVELWDRDSVGADLLGRAETDAQGHFVIPYDPADAGPGDLPDLQLRVYAPGTDRLVHVVRGDDDVTVQRYDFGTHRVRCWEYAAGPLPRLAVAPGDDPPQDFAPGRRPVLLRNLARHAHVHLRHRVSCRTDSLALTLEQVQRDYPPTPPLLLDRANPGYTRTDAYFVDRMLNGFYPAPLQRQGDRFHVRYCFDGDEHNGKYDLPNAEATFVLQGGVLVPEQIVLQHRVPGGLAPCSPLAEPIVVRPGDGERWMAAKRIFTSSHIVAGEVDGHLCRAHLDVEQYALAMFRNLRRSPLRAVLAPHLKEVTTINWQGQSWVYGDSGIVPRISGLTPQAVGLRFVDQMGRVDWRDFAPPLPLGPDHRWAHVAGLYWELLGDYVGEVLHAQRDAIAASWYEVVGFSRDLACRSAPFTGQEPGTRITAGGTVRAVHPFAWSSSPTDDDWVRLREVCRYAIFRATLWHSWINDKQLEDGGDVRLGTLGLRGGGFGDDRTVGALPVDASEQLYMVGVLVGTGYGFLLANEDGDVPAELIERLVSRRQDFAAHGLDIGAIRSRVNI